MPIRRTVRRLTVWGAVAALAVTLPPAAPLASADHANPPGPVNAQSTFLWGRPLWQDDFESAMKDHWRVEGPGLVRTQFGMLTLNTAERGTVSATLTRAGNTTGRWEIRLRSRRYSTAHGDYRVRTELVPAGDLAQHCGAQDIALESYQLGGNRAHHYIRSLPDREFAAFKGLNLGKNEWHTFAVEVTRERIAWFVDAHVITTERRPAALSGVPFTVRFTMVAEPDTRMNKSRMQMDWLRYFTLERRNAKRVAGPAPRETSYADAC